MSDDRFNKSSGLFVAVLLTSVEKPQFGRFRPKISAGEANLRKDSWAQTDQIATLSSSRLTSRIGMVGARTMNEVIDRLKILLHVFP